MLLKNVMGLWILQSCKKEWSKKQPDIGYDKLVHLAIKAMGHTRYIEPDNDLFFNPESMPKAINEYLRRTNQTLIDEDDIGQMTRVIYESLAMKYRYVIERIERAANVKADKIYVIGGGGKNKLLNQFTANATGKKVLVGSNEASTLGNLLTQAYGCKKINSLAEMRQVARNSVPTEEFNSEMLELWEKEYQRFLKIIHNTSLK